MLDVNKNSLIKQPRQLKNFSVKKLKRQGCYGKLLSSLSSAGGLLFLPGSFLSLSSFFLSHLC